MSNRLTFSLASLIVLIALGLVFVATPANAASFATNAKINDVSVVQGAAIDITFPTATNTETDSDPVVATEALMVATLTPLGGGAVSPSTADPPTAETAGTLQGLVFTFDADTGVGKLKGNANPNEVTRILVTYTVSESDGADTDTDDATPVSLVFAFEVTAQTNLLKFPAGASIADKELTVGTAFGEILPAAQDGIGPLTYSLVGVTTETPANSGIFTGGTLPTGLSFTASSRLLTGIPTVAATRAVVTYRVTDSTPTTPVMKDLSFTITVKARPTGPSFAIAKVPDAAYTKGHMIEALTLPMADATYAVGGLTYKLEPLPKGLSFDATSRMLTGTPNPDAAGDTAAMYTATDTANNMKSIPFKITVNDVVSVTAPANVMDHVLGKSFADITVADAMGGTGAKTVAVTGLPAGLMYASKKITGDPTATGTTTVTITATDTLGATGTKDFTIEVEAAPTLSFKTVVAPQTYMVGTPIAPMLLPEGTGGIANYTYALEGLPAGINFAPATRLLSGTPTTATATADYSYVISDSAFSHIAAADRTDAHAANTITLPISITVTAPAPTVNSAPTFGDATIDSLVATAGQAISGRFLPEATDADNDTLTYSIVEALPSGLMFDASTRALTGTPRAVMAQTAYTYMVADGNGGSDTIGFFITVNATTPGPQPPANSAPTFGDATIANITATAGQMIDGRFLPEASDADGDSISYVLSPALPAGLTFNRVTRALTGTPSAAMAQRAYTYTAVALGGTDTINFFITVNAAPNRAPVYAVTTPIAITGTAGVAITPVSAAATDPDGDTLAYSWDVDETALGLMLNTSTGMISGTPKKVHTGSHPVKAMDPDGLYATRGVMVTIAAAPAANVAPVVMITTADPTASQMGSFAIAYTATDANADDTVTVNVSHTITPAGTTGYTVDSSTAGMVTITQAAGSPIAVITVTVTATDAAGLMGSDSITVTFAARGTAPVDTTPPTVVITVAPAPAGANVHADTLRVTLNFNEPVQPSTIDIGRAATDAPVLQISDPMVSATDNTIYTVDVLSEGYRTRATTSVLLKRGVKDLAGNATTSDMVGTYTSPAAPVPTVAISGPASLNCETGDRITLTVTGTSETLVAGDITIGAGWKMGTDNNPSDGTFDLVPDGNNAIGITSVKVDVKANAVGTNAAVSKTFTVGPVLTIPAGGYIAVVRPEHMSSTHLNDPLYLGSLGVRGLPIDIQGWDCMPDLTVFFGRSGAGSGGGALVVKQSAAHTGAAIGKGSVGISEIMWASDEGTIHGLTSNTMQAREQWIELHNLNAHEVKVTLFARPTNTALVTEANEIDRASNFEIGNSWVVKGQNGNSALGSDFVSMWRHKNNNNYAHGDNNGKNGGKWNASTLIYRTRGASLAGRGATNPTYSFKGTPGRSNTISPAGPPVKTPVPRSPVIFNEIANRSDGALEWIELRNVTDAEVNLRNYRISILTGKGQDRNFYLFPVNDDTKIPAKGLLLLVATDPRNNDGHPVAVGHNILGKDDQVLGLGQDQTDPKPHLVRYRVTPFAVEMPDDGEFILILRKPDNHENKNEAGKGPAELASDDGNAGNDDLDKIVDLAGHVGGDKLKDVGAPHYTSLWPLKVFGASFSHGKLEVDKVHFRRDAGRDGVHGEKNEGGKTSFHDYGYTGIGYKRHAKAIAAHGGTPGHHDTRKNLVGEIAATGTVIISEVMYSQTDVGYPQWIELYNTSKTQSVNLKSEAGWRLLIENHDNGTDPVEFLSGTLNFKSSDVQTILPQQTVMVVSAPARRSGSAYFDSSVIFPNTRVFSVWSKARGEFGMKRSTNPILSETGFYLKLIDGKGTMSDEVGNLDAGRRRLNVVEWDLPMMDDGERASIIRRVDKGNAKDGLMSEGWLSASMPDYPFKDVPQTWYGHPEDRGTPGITGGRVLPVSLSKFRPERLESGDIVIRWITESELNNAGFNILRSEKRDGEFKQINTQLIAGKGTTSERNAYTYTDTSAKPNVVYYYQIQDVSLDGKVQTLRMSRLKGHISAAGKATTTWGELKALQ